MRANERTDERVAQYFSLYFQSVIDHSEIQETGGELEDTYHPRIDEATEEEKSRWRSPRHRLLASQIDARWPLKREIGLTRFQHPNQNFNTTPE